MKYAEVVLRPLLVAKAEDAEEIGRAVNSRELDKFVSFPWYAELDQDVVQNWDLFRPAARAALLLMAEALAARR